MKISRQAALSFLSVNTGYVSAFALRVGLTEDGSTLRPAKREVKASSIPAPVVVNPSQKWEGNDGLWSTFEIQIGNTQSMRLLPSTASPLTWVITDGKGCSDGASNNCTDTHGGIFSPQNSKTWEPVTNESVRIDKSQEDTVEASLGFDNVKLGNMGADTVYVNNSFIAGVNGTSSTWLGALGLNPRAMNISGVTASQPVGITAKMKNQNLIPSLSWAYTAGAGYWMGSFYGSLILGGYDAARLLRPPSVDPELAFPLDTGLNQDFLVGISSIKASGTALPSSGAELLSLETSIFASIDSTSPFLRLPESVCKSFEAAFGLVWNSQADLYTLNTSQHDILLKTDPQVTFTLSPTLPPSTVNKTVSITLPYAAFDLSLTSRDVKEETLYFPLKRAAQNNSFILGRAFLQEAYLIADYERRNFSIWPVNWSWSKEKAKIITITPTNSTELKDPEVVHKFLSKTAIAGISVGASFIALALALALFLYIHQKRKTMSIKELSGNSDHELHEDHRFEIAGIGKFELDGVGRPHEADGRPVAFEMDAGRDGAETAPIEMMASVSEETALEAGSASKYGTDGSDSMSTARAEERDSEQRDGIERSGRKANSKSVMSFSDFFKITQRSHR